MKSRKHQKLKRNPFVRFIRGVFRLLRVLFRSKQQNLRSSDRSIEAIPPSNRLPADFDGSDRSSAISGDLVGEATQPNNLTAPHLMTIGDLLESVKWQVPAVTTLQSNIVDESATTLIADYSRN